MKQKEKFYGVNEVGYITIEKYDIKKANVYVEMEAQGTDKKSPDKLVMIFSAEQIMDMHTQVVNNLFNNHE